MQIKPQGSYYITLLSQAKILKCDITEHQKGNSTTGPHIPLAESSHSSQGHSGKHCGAAWRPEHGHQDCTGGLSSPSAVFTKVAAEQQQDPWELMRKAKSPPSPDSALPDAFEEALQQVLMCSRCGTAAQGGSPTVPTGGTCQDIRDVVLDLLLEGRLTDLGSQASVAEGQG